MMIEFNAVFNGKPNCPAVLRFGNGDISVSSFHLLHTGPGICFKNVEAEEIGMADLDADDPRRAANDPQVVFTFSRPESIDVLIEHLQDAKKAFLEASNKIN